MGRFMKERPPFKINLAPFNKQSRSWRNNFVGVHITRNISKNIVKVFFVDARVKKFKAFSVLSLFYHIQW